MIRSFGFAAALLAASCTSGPFFSSNVVGGCSKDSDCSLGAVCDPARKICVKATPPTVSTVVVTPSAQAGSNGFYTRAAGVNVPVDITVVEGTKGVGATGVTLAINGHSYVQTTFTTVAGTTRMFHIDVPSTEAVNGGFEGSAPFTLDAADSVGNTLGPVSNPAWVLPIDDAGPVVSVAVDPVAGPAPDATVSGVPWFNQTNAGDIDIKAIITDQGSGVSLSSLMLVKQGTTTRIDRVGMVTAGPGANEYHFKILRTGTGAPVALGTEAPLTYKLIALDNLGNPQQADSGGNVSVNTLGIDGKVPAVTFDPTSAGYPAVNSGCGDGTGSDTSLICGHDGQTLWRRGDDGKPMFFTASDSGSGPVGTGATCTIPGQTCSISSFSSGQYNFTVNPSQMTTVSGWDDNGNATVSLTVTAKDAVGNQGTASTTLNLSRFRWARLFTSKITNIAASPVVTPAISGTRQILIGGQDADANGAIVALSPNGALIGSRIGTGLTVTSNMAYSPVTNRLYVLQENANFVAMYSVAAGGLSVLSICTLSASVKMSGAPAIIGGSGAERMLAGDSGAHLLWALAPSTATSCDAVLDKSKTVGTGTVKSPTTDGTNVYAAYGATGIAMVSFSGSPPDFGATVTLKPLSLNIIQGVAITGSVLFGESTNNRYHSRSLDLNTDNWTGTPGQMNGPILSTPIIHGGLLFGSADTNDGFLRTFKVTDGSATAPAFVYPSSGSGIGNISAVTIGADSTPVAYFSADNDAGGAAVEAVSYDATPTLTRVWRFKGSAVTKNSTDVHLTALGTEPTLSSGGGGDSAGTLYLAAGSTVYALLSDSPGAVVPTGGTNWPRVGFDNCNSSNTSYTNCQ